jgi:hypothetical protein
VFDSCAFTDWGNGGDQSYAIHAIADSTEAADHTKTTGPVDITDCDFILTTDNNKRECTPVMNDYRGWIRTIARNTFTSNGHSVSSGFYVWRPGNGATDITIEDNTVSGVGRTGIAIQELEYYGAAPTVRVRRNYIADAAQKDALDTEALRVRGFTAASDVTVRENIIDGTMDGTNDHHGIFLHSCTGAKVYHNLVMGGDGGIVLKGAAGEEALLADIRNNALVDNRGYGVQVLTGGSVATLDYNGYHGNATADTSGVTVAAEAHGVFADLLVGADYRLGAGSPGLDAGQPLYGEDIDYAGFRRYWWNRPDLAVYEQPYPRHYRCYRRR